MSDADAKPEKALLYGVLDRAIRDASGLGWDCPQHEQRHANDWFQSDSEEEFSFLWICLHLDLDPERVRKVPSLFAEIGAKSRCKARMKPEWSNIMKIFLHDDHDALGSVPNFWSLQVF